MDATIIRDKLIGNDDERAVSPVIGVILMVAITVILAAVIAAFVMDLGDMSESANAGVDFDEDDEEVSVQVIDAGNTDAIYVEVDDSTGADSEFLESGDSLSAVDRDEAESWEVGNSSTVEKDAPLSSSGNLETITVYGEVGGDAQVIATWDN